MRSPSSRMVRRAFAARLPFAVILNARAQNVGDTGSHRIRKIPVRTGSPVAGSGIARLADGPPDTARFNLPRGVDAAGNLYVGDTGNDRMREIEP